ncbi:MAG TPA: hypothetical protein PLF35_07585, partial [Prolixibacteraceae bacterium]|nr:hypothetical protein [Prolixibacteraceae bacterium]
MKKNLMLFVLFIIPFTVLVAQENKQPDEGKQGWNFGALPTITFDTDLGFQYGALVNLYNYGDGSHYPKYLHNIYIEASRFTKGSAIYRLSYDSEFLIPGIRVTSDLAYLPDEAYDFYGFNGFESKYNKSWIQTFLLDENGEEVRNDDGFRILNPDYKSRVFYKYQNRTFRFKTDLQFPIGESPFLALVGFNLQSFNISTVNI